MRVAMDRLKKPFKYRLYTGTSGGKNSDGLYTGELTPTYGSIQEDRADIGFALGKAKHTESGILPDFDRTLLLDHDLGINEYSQLWIDDLNSTTPDHTVKRVMISQTGIVRIEASKVMK